MPGVKEDLARRPSSRRRLTNEEILEDLRRVANGIGRGPSCAQFNERTRTLTASGVAFRFGSWSAAIHAAGFTPATRGFSRKVSDQDVLEDLRRITQRLGRPPTQREFANSTRTISPAGIPHRWGNWTMALQVAGVAGEATHLAHGRRHADETIINSLRDAAADLNEPLRMKSYEQWATAHGRPVSSTVAARYGSFADACQQAGVRCIYNPRVKWSRETAESAISAFIANHERFPARHDFDHEEDLPGRAVVARLFSREELTSWRQQTYRDWVIRRIHDWNDEHGRPPARRDWEPDRAGASVRAAVRARYLREDWPDGARVRKVFGSLSSAITAAGLTPVPGTTPIEGLEETRTCRGCGSEFSQPVRWGTTRNRWLYCAACREGDEKNAAA